MKRTAVVLALVSALIVTTVAGEYSASLIMAKTITVPNDYASIQGAIDAAKNGDTVHVKRGYYTETLVITNKSISVIGEDRNQTIIDARKRGGNVVLIEGANHVTLANFTLGNGKSPDNRSQDTFDGMRISSSDYSNIINNTIILIPFGNGINAESNNLLIEGNTIINCSHTAIIIRKSNNVVRNNEYANIEYFIPIYDLGDNNTVEGNHGITVANMQSPFHEGIENHEFPATIAAATILVIAAMVIGLVFFKKRKHTK